MHRNNTIFYTGFLIRILNTLALRITPKVIIIVVIMWYGLVIQGG